jgi:hypothetical protein
MGIRGLMITVTRTYEVCAMRVMLDAQDSKAQQLCMRSGHED